MKFESPLIEGRLIKRYKRFLADVELADGSVVTAHCANSGSMLSVRQPGSRVWLSQSDNPKRKLKYTWELIEVGGSLVGINTGWPNRLAGEAIADGRVPELTGYASLRHEVKYGRNSRIDILLEDPDRPPCYVEVKNVTLKRDDGPNGRDAAEFPDAVTSRGAKHLRELADMVENGARAAMFYLVQREDCEVVSIAGDIDPGYADGLAAARSAGVEVMCYACSVTQDGIEVARSLPLKVYRD